jgi:DNA mismatch repair ATPase MutS
MNLNDKLRNQLVKEALARANKQEKIEHEEIREKKRVVVKRLKVAQEEFDGLVDRSKRNEYPKNGTNTNNKPASQMSNEEFSEYMRQSNKHTEEHFAWSSESIAIMTEQVKIANDFMESILPTHQSEHSRLC